MLTRLWFVVSVLWGAVFFFNCTTRTKFSFDQYDAMLVFGPLVLGLAFKRIGRYVVRGN